ncbi:MAG: preprotein translocase subunit SecA [Rhizobiales bacterium]|nr:preprotein translocase subunit SecA [Hyphomicrobiales bacterium]
MLGSVIRKIFGSANDRKIKALRPIVEEINNWEDKIKAFSDEQFKTRTAELKAEIANGKKLDDILPEAFAMVREASVRTLGLRHFDVQLIGGMILHGGNITEMRTGEGKTLVATLAAYLNALNDKGVHVVTVNDYLAKRDSEWMGEIYEFLGLSVGAIVGGLDDDVRQEIYNRDIVYATNNELGFDYLRDNMKYHTDAMAQRGHHFAIVDEVDSILIDEARTPLIISGPLDSKSDLYVTINELIPLLLDEDYTLDEKSKTVNLSEEGNEHIEKILVEQGLMDAETSFYDSVNITLIHHVNQALRAHKLFTKDKEYIVRDDEVQIIDEFTGRVMDGRRYSEGQHQALEAKEGVTIQPESQTLASVTFQNYFRLYSKLSGMTGTALTEAEEFNDIYKLDVVDVPTNVDVKRIDDDDQVYRTKAEKNRAIVLEVQACIDRQQPVLVGTGSIEASEIISTLLSDAKIKHNVLNARHHEQEATIIANAGRLGAVTIATNMAGRGTDIQLGGNLSMRITQELGDIEDATKKAAAVEKLTAEIKAEKIEVIEKGGLFVLSAERHESRRIDNQLRGRSGRQGDPGHSKFFVSIEDDLMRIFMAERMDGMLKRLGLEEGEAIVHSLINRTIEKAQQKVEAHNFDIRKNLLKFDDVMNDQRKVIFEQRLELMEDDAINETILDMRHDVVDDVVSKYMPENAYAEQWDIEGLSSKVLETFRLDLPLKDWAAEEGIANEEMFDRIIKAADEDMAARAARITPDVMRQVERAVLLQTLDSLWRDHLQTLDHLRQGVGLRGYGQRDPLNEYKTEAFSMFEEMLDKLREAVTSQLSHVELNEAPTDVEEYDMSDAQVSHETDVNTAEAGIQNNIPLHHNTGPLDPEKPESWGKIARNAPCPCKSGKKYKHCHGKLA